MHRFGQGRAKGKFWGREYAFLAIFAKFSNDNTSGSSNLIDIKILTQTLSHKGDCVVVQCYQNNSSIWRQPPF